MNRKAKIIINLSIITIVLASAAQLYTNHRIDQTLDKFPYHFTDDFAVHVTQKSKDLFTRDLVFSIETDDGEKNEIVTTHLTAFPFAVAARSELSPALVRKVNEKLNITIDNNVISSKFSVVGDYLQSTMETKFRDITNTPQSLNTDLNFIAKTNFIEIENALSGFNYNAVTKFHDMKGSYTLQPLGNQSYDLVKADIKLGMADIKDGENNHYQINNLKYQLNKNYRDNEYNLDVALSGDKFRLENNAEDLQIENLTLNSQQTGIALDVTFHDQLIKLNKGNQSVKQAITILSDYLLDNRQWLVKGRFDALTLKDNNTVLDLAKTELSGKFAQQDDKHAGFEFSANSASLGIREGDNKLAQLKKLSFSTKSERLNLAESAQLIRDYFPENSGTKNTFQPNKDNVKFIKAFQNFVINYRPTTDTHAKVERIEVSDINGKNIEFTLSEKYPSENDLTANLVFSAGQISVEKENFALNNIALNIPMSSPSRLAVGNFYLCSHRFYAVLCNSNLSAETSGKWFADNFAQAVFQVDDATLAFDLDTYPKSSRAGKVEAKLSGKILPLKEKADSDLLFAKLNNRELHFTLTVPEHLVANDAEGDEIKTTSDFWLWLKGLKRNSVFMLQNGNYHIDFVEKDGESQLNRQELEVIENEALPELQPEVQPLENQKKPQ